MITKYTIPSLTPAIQSFIVLLEKITNEIDPQLYNTSVASQKKEILEKLQILNESQGNLSQKDLEKIERFLERLALFILSDKTNPKREDFFVCARIITTHIFLIRVDR